MRLTSNLTTGTLRWRAFDLADSVCAIGLAEGSLSSEGSATYNNPTEVFKLDIKRDEGSFWLAPGAKFSNEDDITVLANDGSVLLTNHHIRLGNERILGNPLPVSVFPQRLDVFVDGTDVSVYRKTLA